MGQAEALERTLTELDRLGRFEEVDAARVQVLRGIAAELDRKGSNSQMWKVYWDALGELIRRDDDADDGLAAALAAISSAAEVGDAEEN